MKEFCVKCKKDDLTFIKVGYYSICDACLTEVRLLPVRTIVNMCVEYKMMSFDTFKEVGNIKAVKTCKEFAHRKVDRFGLMLHSAAPGNGKTHLGIATLREWLMESWIPFYEFPTAYVKPFEIVTEPNLFLDIRKTFGRDSELTEWDITERYSKVEFLLIDDVGKYSANDSKFLQRVWYNIINERYLNHRLTVITTNKNGAELQYYLGEYTFDRICGMVQNKITEVFGESWRKK